MYLAPRLTAQAGAAATYAMQTAQAADAAVADMIGVLGAVFMANCVLSWDFLVGGEGQTVAVPVNRDTIDEYLPWAGGGSVVIEECDRLYSEDFLHPLGVAKPKSSRAGRTVKSTSASLPSGPKPRRPSKPSSRNGSDGRSFAVPVS